MLLSRSPNLRNIVKTQLRKTMNRIAKEIERDLKAACPVESGELKKDIHREGTGKYSVIIGSRLPQMYFSNYGNGGGKPIKAKKGKYMWFQSKNDYNLPMQDGYYYAEEVRPYKGTNWMKRIAAKYRARYGGR